MCSCQCHKGNEAGVGQEWLDKSYCKNCADSHIPEDDLLEDEFADEPIEEDE